MSYVFGLCFGRREVSGGGLLKLVVGSSHPIQYYEELFDKVVNSRDRACVVYFDKELTLSRSNGYDTSGWDSINYEREDRLHLFGLKDIIKFFKNKPQGKAVYYSRGWYSKNLALAVFFSHLFGWVTVCHVDNHPGEFRSFLGRLIAPIKWVFLSSFVDHFIATGTGSRLWLLSNGIRQEHISIIPHCNPYAVWKRKTIGSADRVLNFGYVGQLVPRKNVDLMLEGFRGSQIQKAKLFIAGCDGVSDDNIRYVGFLNRNELQEFYKTIDCLILPSLEDSWGVVINEAIQFDCAVLASMNCGAAMDLVYTGCNGYLFNPLDSSEFRDKLSQISLDLVTMDWQIRRSEVNQLISTRTSMDVVASKINDVLDTCA